MPNKLTDDVVSSVIKQTPSGAWIWHLDEIDPAYIAKLTTAKCKRVYLKVFDDYADAGLLPQTQKTAELRKAGLSVVGWGYHFDQREDIDVAAEAQAIKQAMDLGLDGYIADLEKEIGFTHVYPTVRNLLAALRNSVGDRFLGYSSFGHPGFHPEIPWRILDENTDVAFPQIYFEKWRRAKWGKDDLDRVQLALKAHQTAGLTNPILPIWGSEEDTPASSSASATDLQAFIGRFPGSSIFRIPGVGEQGVAFDIDYSAPQLAATVASATPSIPLVQPVSKDAGAASVAPSTREQMTLVAMRISGRFEGDDPWANITGNFDGEGLTCGMLGKTFGNGEQQKLIQRYLDSFGADEMLKLMPQVGREYQRLCSLEPDQGTAEISHWSINGNSARLMQPYLGELQRFWKSPKMVSVQFQAALDSETRFAEQQTQIWDPDGSLKTFCFFFDIATQNGSLKGLGPEDIDKFYTSRGSSLDAFNFICGKCQNAQNSRFNASDAQRNGQLWKTLVSSVDEMTRRLFTLGWLRSQLASAAFMFTVMNRRGTLALGRGFVDEANCDFRDDFGLLNGSSITPVAVPAVPGSLTTRAPTAPQSATVPRSSAGPVDGRTFRVAVSSLNLRSSPDNSNQANVLLSLPEGQLLEVLDSSRVDNWWRVSLNFRGSPVEGYVSSVYLSDGNSTAAASSSSVVAVNLPAIAKLADPPNANPLSESAAPHRQSTSPTDSCAELARIINFLDVQHSRRYRPTSTSTFCNVYAFDYCYLAGVYLPRVWWLDSAIEKLSQHQVVTAELGKTVDELRANDIEVWFDQFGTQFGWRHTVDPDELQEAANQGGVAIIVARNRITAASGHIVAVPPETPQFKAQRAANGNVIVPLQSQAGRVNFSYGMGSKGTQWWTDQSRFRAFGLWFHI